MRTLLFATTAALAFAGPAHAGASEDARAYVERIEALDDQGPKIGAVIVSLDADAAAASAERAEAAKLPLAGRTVLVKDNIETREWPTTAGSNALANNRTERDAPMITRLREAGGVVLGKTNLSEWANIRSTNSSSGWSAIGGLTRNPHATDRNSCGSSSGSGAAVAAGFAWAAIGTETDGSITCPSSINGIVGFKPTVGMVSRTFVVPISSSQDTAGPMAQTVRDAALLLNAIAGPDPADAATADAADHVTDFSAGLASASLAGKRLGVLRKSVGDDQKVTALFEAALDDLRRAGAEVVELDYEAPAEMGASEFTVLLYELRETLASYLGGSPADLPIRTLADAIAFNRSDTAELRWFGQEIFEQAEKTTDIEVYRKARTESLRMAGAEGIDKLLADNRLDFLVAPTVGPAWTTDLVNGDHYNGSIGAGSLAAIAGYPHLTVPMGAVEGLPVGLSFMAGKWADEKVLQAGAAYEKARTATLATPSLARWSPPGID